MSCTHAASGIEVNLHCGDAGISLIYGFVSHRKLLGVIVSTIKIYFPEINYLW